MLFHLFLVFCEQKNDRVEKKIYWLWEYATKILTDMKIVWLDKTTVRILCQCNVKMQQQQKLAIYLLFQPHISSTPIIPENENIL